MIAFFIYFFSTSLIDKNLHTCVGFYFLYNVLGSLREKFILLLLTIHIYGDIMIVLNIVKAVTRKVTVRILRRERTFGESPQG